MRPNFIVVFDCETTSSRVSDTEICQIAAAAIDPRTLAIQPDCFNSLMRPLEWDKIQDEALDKNKKTREELALAPHPSEVWPRFASWVSQWNLKKKSGPFTSPIPAGHNIVNFDLPIYERYCKKYKTVRRDKNGEETPNIFTDRMVYDTMLLLGYWTENLVEPAHLSLDYLRRHFGMPKASIDGAHDALQDVKDTAAILVKLLELSRRHSPNVIFKDCFDVDKVNEEKERRKAAKNKKKEAWK